MSLATATTSNVNNEGIEVGPRTIYTFIYTICSYTHNVQSYTPVHPTVYRPTFRGLHEYDMQYAKIRLYTIRLV